MIQENKPQTGKSVLGKGLASLLSGVAPLPEAQRNDNSVETGNRERHLGITVLNPEEIQANPFQPRRGFDDRAIEELAQSIRTNGLIQPLVVRRAASGAYELIAGERRLRAAKRAGLKSVPVVIRKSTDRESLELALIENIQRQDLNCIDSALAYHQLAEEFSLTQEEIAQRVGKDRATVSNHLRLLKLPEAVILDLKRERLSFGHARALLGLEDPTLCMKARDQILERHLSVREAEALVLELRNRQVDGGVANGAAGTTPPTPVEQRLRTLSLELTRHVGARVEIQGSDRKGKLTIRYSSPEVLERVLDLLKK